MGSQPIRPVRPPAGLRDVIGIAAGSEHGLAVKEDGTVVAWGAGKFDAGSTADSNMGQSMVPPGLRNVVAVTAGAYHSLALKQNDTVVAWGFNSVGQCTLATNLHGVVALAANLLYTMALRTNGTVLLSGGLGVPEPVLTNAVAIALGLSNSKLALRPDGTVFARGCEPGWILCDVPPDLPSAAAVCAPSLALLSTAGPPPTIFRHPRTQTAASGSTVTFSVRAFGPPPLSYQWL
jgi:alpha-tubulin suppressor-like RCC1 family protein